MVKNDKPLLSEKEKIALAMNSDGNGIILDMKGTTADQVIKEQAIKEINKEMEVYVDTFKKHAQNLEESVNKLAVDPEKLEIMPIGNYVLIKEFKTNPFQQIVRNSSGLIVDMGGMAPIFKNTDSGETEIEEAFILCGAVQEVGPECKWLQPGDAVFYSKPSAVPIPFYKAGLVLVNETRILSVVNESLSERFNNNKNVK